MIGPYTARAGGVIGYRGNRIFPPVHDITTLSFPPEGASHRVTELKQDALWPHIARINHRINAAANEYFDSLGALFTLLPLTTRMISSPGAAYARDTTSYNTDTCPITLKWFDLPQDVFLSESSQIYLELALLQHGVDHVYSIYNSFRRENADPTHLSEFHHLEYEGKIDQSQNERVIAGLLKAIVRDLLSRNADDMAYFLDDTRLAGLDRMISSGLIPTVTFADVLQALYRETRDDKYTHFTLRHFGPWEEVKTTEIFGGILGVKEFPLLEVSFYHASLNREPAVAESTDILWPGYREVVGSGHRVRSLQELEDKATIFNLSKKDYEPYLMSRRFSDYVETSGFGLGWERLLQGMLEMPAIWNATHFPRGHTEPRP